MPRVTKPKADALGVRLNIPVRPDIKRRVFKLAKQFPGSMSPTQYARMLLERAVEQAEKQLVGA